MAYMRLGDLLIAAGAITEEQLQTALQTQKQSGQRLGDVLIDSGIITQRQLIDALQMQLGVDYIDLTRVSIPVELAKYVPRAIAKKYCVVPVKLVKDELYVAMSDPLDFVAQEELKSASRRQIVPMIATRRAVEQAIATLYGNEGTTKKNIPHPRLSPTNSWRKSLYQTRPHAARNNVYSHSCRCNPSPLKYSRRSRGSLDPRNHHDFPARK